MRFDGFWAVAAFAAPLALVGPAQAKLSKGDPAPPFELTSVGGNSVSSQTVAQGGLAILTFISLDSKPSRELAVNLAGLAKDHATEGLTVVAVAADSADKLKEFASAQSLGYSVCPDPSKETVK